MVNYWRMENKICMFGFRDKERRGYWQGILITADRKRYLTGIRSP